MIAVTVTKRKEEYLRFESQGHAGYAEEGSDIICSAVSALEINAINSIDAFTEDAVSVDKKDGYLAWDFIGENSENAHLLMDSLLLGLAQIQDHYDKQFISVTIREV